MTRDEREEEQLDQVDASGEAEAAEPAADSVDAEIVEEAEVVDEQAGSEDDPAAQLQRERDQYLEVAQRTQAELENYRKRMATEVQSAEIRGKAALAEGMLGVLDNLERALESIEVDPSAARAGEASVEGPLEQGVALTYRELCGVVDRAGVDGYDPTGERFDPTWHEALQTRPVDDVESGTVVEVLQKGYRIGDRVLRPARVIVSA